MNNAVFIVGTDTILKQSIKYYLINKKAIKNNKIQLGVFKWVDQ